MALLGRTLLAVSLLVIPGAFLVLLAYGCYRSVQRQLSEARARVGAKPPWSQVRFSVMLREAGAAGI